MNRNIYIADSTSSAGESHAFLQAIVDAVIRNGDLPTVVDSSMVRDSGAQAIPGCDLLIHLCDAGDEGSALQRIGSSTRQLGIRTLHAFAPCEPHRTDLPSTQAAEGELIVAHRPVELQLNVYLWLARLQQPLPSVRSELLVSGRQDVLPTIPHSVTGFVPHGRLTTPEWFRLYSSIEWVPAPDFRLITADCSQFYWTLVFRGHGASPIRCTMSRSRAHIEAGCQHQHDSSACRGQFGYAAGFGCQRPLFSDGWDVAASWQLWRRAAAL